MGTPRSRAATTLRITIESLPRRTRVAMLEGIETNPIIVGAYANKDGICPMLAAHRSGGRTPVIEFAKAWDRFAYRNVWRGRPRRASKHELLILKLYLQASLLAEPGPTAAPMPTEGPAADRPQVDRADEPLACRSPSEDRDRTSELARTTSRAWTTIVRGLNEYERVLAQVGAELPGAPTAEASPAIRR